MGLFDVNNSLALRLATEGPVKTLKTPRRVRILFKRVYIADTTDAVMVWEHPYFPQYYLPHSALSKNGLEIEKGEEVKNDDGKVVATMWNLKVGDKTCDKAFGFADDLSGKASELAGLIKIEFGAMDQWFEEDGPIFVHPKDPFKRVDILPSSRAIRVAVGGHVVAESPTSMHLYETGLPVRYYVPLTALDSSVLRASETRTRCPYKGEAEYYDVVVEGKEFKDVVWFYSRPTLECALVAGLCCFYNEKVEIWLQKGAKGSEEWEKLEQPKTHFG